MATKREAKPPTITEAMAKAFCEGMPTIACRSSGDLKLSGAVHPRMDPRMARTVASRDRLTRVLQVLWDKTDEQLKTKPPRDCSDVYLVADELKIITDALAWYEVHKEHTFLDPEPFGALANLVAILMYVSPPLFEMSRNCDQMAVVRDCITRPTNRESLNALIAKEIPGYLKEHQRERARGNGIRYVARRLFPILKARNLWTESEDALRKHLERHHAAHFVRRSSGTSV
jgi:hypothetical protein